MVNTIKESSTRNIAMLIDGDNAQPLLIAKILAEAGKYGALTIRRIYGDWTTANMQGWKGTLNAAAIQPIQQFRYTVGKNATDSASNLAEVLQLEYNKARQQTITNEMLDIAGGAEALASAG